MGTGTSKERCRCTLTDGHKRQEVFVQFFPGTLLTPDPRLVLKHNHYLRTVLAIHMQPKAWGSIQTLLRGLGALGVDGTPEGEVPTVTSVLEPLQVDIGVVKVISATMAPTVYSLHVGVYTDGSLEYALFNDAGVAYTLTSFTNIPEGLLDSSIVINVPRVREMLAANVAHMSPILAPIASSFALLGPGPPRADGEGGAAGAGEPASAAPPADAHGAAAEDANLAIINRSIPEPILWTRLAGLMKPAGRTCLLSADKLQITPGVGTELTPDLVLEYRIICHIGGSPAPINVWTPATRTVVADKETWVFTLPIGYVTVHARARYTNTNMASLHCCARDFYVRWGA